jgi:hypothetical protein
MSGTVIFDRACNLLQGSLAPSSRDALVTAVDIETMARTMAFVTNIAQAPNVPLSDAQHAEALSYTVASATLLADRVRQRLGVDDVDPLFDLPARLPPRLAALVFPLHTAAVSSVCAVFCGIRFLFVSTRVGDHQLLECARALGTIFALSARCHGEDFAFIETCAPTVHGIGPRAYFSMNFARHLLIPTSGLAVSLKIVRELLNVKRQEIGDIELLYAAQIFGVSFADMARRCERAGLLPPGGARSIERFLSDKFGSPENRAAQLDLPVRPHVAIPAVPSTLLPVLRTQVQEGVISVADSALALGTTEELLRPLLQQRQRSEGFWQ